MLETSLRARPFSTRHSGLILTDDDPAADISSLSLSMVDLDILFRLPRPIPLVSRHHCSPFIPAVSGPCISPVDFNISSGHITNSLAL